MRTAVVFGATGGMGFALTEELINKNIKTVAFARSKQNLLKKKLEWGDSPLVETMVGDAMNPEDVKNAVSKADAVFHTISIPYQDWDPALSIILSNILEECRKQKKPFIYVDNIYSYGFQETKVSEEANKKPHTKKGKFREKLLEQIKLADIPYIIAHFPDFYGPNVGNTLLQYTFEQILAKKTGRFVGKTTIPREFIFIKDGASALVELALRKEAYGEVWNIPGAGTITGKEIEQLGAAYLKKKIILKPVHRWMISAFGLFDPFMREYSEMMYLNEKPVILDGSKYEQRIGPIPKTSYKVGIEATLSYLLKTSQSGIKK